MMPFSNHWINAFLSSVCTESGTSSPMYLQHGAVPLPASIFVHLASPSCYYQALYPRFHVLSFLCLVYRPDKKVSIAIFSGFPSFCSNKALFQVFVTTFLEAYRLTSAKGMHPFWQHYLLFLPRTLQHWYPASHASHLHLCTRASCFSSHQPCPPCCC